VQTEDTTSSSRHFRRPIGGDPRPNLVADSRDDHGMRMCQAFPLKRATSPYHSGPRGHADVTVPLYETLPDGI
jgi:hypothetical protein